MTGWSGNLRHSFRSYARQPWLWALAVLTLGIGVGANATVYSTMRALMLRPLETIDQPGLTVVYSQNPRQGRERVRVSRQDFADWRRESRSFAKLVAHAESEFSMSGSGLTPERLTGALASEGLFEVAKGGIALGRGFLPEDYRDGKAVILSHQLWETKFQRNPQVVGRTLRLDDGQYTVVGVATKETWWPSAQVRLWTPLLPHAAKETRGSRHLQVYGVLKQGVARSDAEQELAGIAARLEAAYPETNAGWGVQALNAYEGFLWPNDRQAKKLMDWLGFSILLIACANVANLQLVRALARRKELALRQALGAGRWSLAGQTLLEAVWLAGPAAALALLAAWWSSGALVSAFPTMHVPLPAWTIDWQIAGFTLTLSLVSVVLFSLAPVLEGTRVDLIDAMKDSGARAGTGRKSRRLAQAFVVVQAALAVVLLATAGLAAYGMWQLHVMDQGYDIRNLATISVSPSQWRYQDDAKAAQYQGEILRRVRSVPGVENAALMMLLPQVQGNGVGTTFQVEGQPEAPARERRSGVWLALGEGAFETLRIPLRAGRAINRFDTAGAERVVVVNETGARALGGGNVIGRRVRLNNAQDEWYTVVGVSGDVKRAIPTQKIEPQFFTSLAQTPRRQVALAARGRGDVTAVLPAIRQAALAVDGDEPLRFDTAEAEFLRDLRGGVTFTGMVAVMAALALFLAGMGLFCVISHQVGQRLPEIGVRMALGAQARAIVSLVTSGAVRLILLGAVLGAAGAYGLSRLMANMFLDIDRMLPVILGGTLGLLLAAAGAACAGPTRRALRISPASILRNE
ncbi:MAG: ADOP family duplicated permease [Bryobacteraceae bacterium]|nr:ADOP family duplicated permease [Bryobacteraceae bacterium]